MNREDRQVLLRAHGLVDRVPGWTSSGSASASIGGAIGYAKDAGVMVQAMRALLLDLACPPHARDELWPDPRAGEVLDALDWWVARRSADGWTVEGARPFPSFAAMLEAYRRER